MLQKLNERIQGVVAWLVIILIAFTFTIFGMDYFFQSRQTSNAKIVVNGTPISNQAFETNFRRARAQQDPSQLTDEKNLQDKVLNQLISKEVTIQSAEKYGFDVSIDQANSAILKIPQFQQDGRFSSEKYQQAINGALFTPESFQNEVEQGMLLNQQRFAFVGSSFSLPDEINRFVRLYLQTRDYNYLVVPSDSLLKQTKISQEDINSYYKVHQNEFMTPEQVKIDYISLSMQDIKAKINVSKEDINNYYNENKSNYLTPAQWQVAHILYALPENATESEINQVKEKAQKSYEALIKDPQKFNNTVKTESADKLSIADNGLMPWISAGSEYDSALVNLTKSGQISPPVKTKHGYELFKLIASKPAVTKSLADVENTIKEQLIIDKAQTQFAQSLEQLSDLSYQTPDSLNPASDALNIKIQHSEPFSRQGGSTALTKNKLIVNSAFSHDVLELSNNSEAIQLDNDAVIVLRVNKHLPSLKQPLATVSNQIQTILAKKQADEKAKEIGASILNSVEEKQQQSILSAHQLTWQTIEKSSRDNDKIDSLINELAFNISKPENRDGVVLDNGDYVVVKLKKINNGELATLDNEHKDSLIQQVEANYGMMDYDIYVNSLIKAAKLEKN